MVNKKRVENLHGTTVGSGAVRTNNISTSNNVTCKMNTRSVVYQPRCYCWVILSS